jgi:molecular chaperone GrpE
MTDNGSEEKVYRIPVRFEDERPRHPTDGFAPPVARPAAAAAVPAGEAAPVEEAAAEPPAAPAEPEAGEPTVARSAFLALARDNARLKTDVARLQTEAYEGQARAHGAEQKQREREEQLLRTQAEFQNYRRRVEREREEALRYANSELMADLLPVLDNFDLALSAAAQGGLNADFLKGVELICKQLKDVLAGYELRALDAVGQPFDPNFHEAVHRTSHPELPADHVAAVHRRGYRYKDRLLRPAMVVVSAGPGNNGKDAGEESAGEPAAGEAAAEPREAGEAAPAESGPASED